MAAIEGASVLPNPIISFTSPTFVNPEDDNISCVICFQVAFENKLLPPAFCTLPKCRGIVCPECNSQGELTKCPTCRTPGELISESLSLGSPYYEKQCEIMKRYNNSIVRCQCGKSMPYFTYKSHQNDCFIPCPNDCGNNISKNNSHEHFSTCKRLKCNKCDKTYLLGRVHHPDECEQNQYTKYIFNESLKIQLQQFELKQQSKYADQFNEVETQQGELRESNYRLATFTSMEFRKYKQQNNNLEKHLDGTLNDVGKLLFMNAEQAKTNAEQAKTNTEQAKKIAEQAKTNAEQAKTIAEQDVKIRDLYVKLDTFANALDSSNAQMKQIIQMMHDKPTKAKTASEADFGILSGRVVTIEFFQYLVGARVKQSGRSSVNIGTIISTHHSPSMVKNKKDVYTVFVEFEKGTIPFIANSKGQFELVHE